jgi:uncharacterized LabA/DUF88 family protein
LKTNFYVDGFNLYYLAVKKTQLKWLDVAKLCATLCPQAHINRIRYFTARVSALPHDPHVLKRQDVYLHALRTIPNLTIHEGLFTSWPRWLPELPLKYSDPTKPPKLVQVLKTEEKGSDVNLATFLLVDCFDDDFDEAVVISNDSDLVLPIKMVNNKFGKSIVVINPTSNRKEALRVNKDLNRVASSYIRMINKKVLANCQFPATLTDAQGTFHKPATW